MDWILVYSLLLKLAFFVVAMEGALWYLRRLDKRLGVLWKARIIPLLESNAVGAGLYFGLRFAGLCLAVAHLLA